MANKKTTTTVAQKAKATQEQSWNTMQTA